MAPLAPQRHSWLIEPLLAAGVGLDEIRTLVEHLACEAVLGPAAPVLMRPVDDRPPEVRAAWVEVIGRMLDLGPDHRPVSGSTC